MPLLREAGTLRRSSRRFLTQGPQLPADRRPFGRRRSACLQLSTGLSPAAPMHVQPL